MSGRDQSKETSRPNEADAAVLHSVTAQTGRALQVEELVSDRRGARMLRLVDEEGVRFALKIATEQETTVAREARTLRALAEVTDHMLVAAGRSDERDWLLLRWIAGRGAYHQVREIRAGAEAEEVRKSRPALAQLYGACCDRVAAVHAAGFLHGDVQPSHLRVDQVGAVHLLDFGQAHRIGEDVGYRGALVHFIAPEVCAQLLSGETALLTPEAEVFSMAATIFFLHTGALAADYGEENHRAMPFEDKLRCIAEGKRRTFAQAGWVEGANGGRRGERDVEDVLEMGLAIDPADRYESMAEFARAWERQARSTSSPILDA